MVKRFEIRNDDDSECLMAPGFQSNVDAWFNQNPYQGEVRRIDGKIPGVTVLFVRDVRDSSAKNEAIAHADAYLSNAGLPTYSSLVLTIEGMVAEPTARNAHDILLGLVKDAAAALERHILPASTVSAADTINELLGVLDNSKTVAELRQLGVAL